MRPLLVGEASRRPGEPLNGKSGRRLAELAGTSFLAREFDRVNLLPDWPGRSGSTKGDAFLPEPARAAASMLLAVSPHRTVILLGRRVASAFGLGGAEWLSWTYKGGKMLGLLPHPSGIVTWWNDPEHVRSARIFLTEAVSRANGSRWAS